MPNQAKRSSNNAKKTNSSKTATRKTQARNSKEAKEAYYKELIEKRKKKIKHIIIACIVIIIMIVFSVIFSLLNINNDKIISGISINNINVSGLSKDEAKNKLSTIIAENKKKELALKYNDYESEITPELIELDYKIDSIVDEAFNIGRDNNIFVNNYRILFTMLFKKNVDIEVAFNQEQLEKSLESISSNLPGAIKEASYYIENDDLIITKGVKGVAIDISATIDKIKDNLKDINKNQQEYIELAIIEKEPAPIDINKIYEEVHKEAQNAYFVKEPFQIFPEVDGVNFSIDEAKTLLKEEKSEYTIKLTITKPEVTIDKIGTEAFPNKLSVFTTRYDASNTNRTTNLRLACEKINGKVILAGETFSYNKTVGERTIANGYKEAKIYSAGQVVDGLGGGICQISSTLYNAVVMANLEIVERRNHQFVTSYLPAGKDATVVYGLTDFQFKNTRKYPIKLTASVQNGIATIEVYGIKEEEEYVINIETKTIGTIPFTTKYEDDPSLSPGTEVVKQNGANGLQTETYVTKSLNGKIVSRELLSKDTYTPMQKIVKKSTKSAEPTQSKEQETGKNSTTKNKSETNTVTDNSQNTTKKEVQKNDKANTTSENSTKASTGNSTSNASEGNNIKGN